MEFIVFVLFLTLLASLIFSLVRKGRFMFFAKLFRFSSIAFGIFLFSYWFMKNSLNKFSENEMTVQIINKLPQPLDFYIIKIDTSKVASEKSSIKHLGKIRSEYFRLDYLKMDKSNEFWVAGYLGKKNMVYFSQHSIPNKNIAQIIEVRNYITQSVKLSEEAKKTIENYQFRNIKFSVWVTLDFLLLFLNLVLIVKRK